MNVGTWRAEQMIRLPSGVRAWLSQMMRTGSRPSGRRQVSSGSSASTVPTPAMMPVRRLRVSWTCARAVSPDTQRLSPVRAAILPSSVMAYLSTTKGVLWVI